MGHCVFCPDNWENLDVVGQDGFTVKGYHRRLIIKPLNPVTLGHVLVIHEQHTENAAESPRVAAELMETASRWVRDQGYQANIITSIGHEATQSVYHTHFHVVPRIPDDGLCLPWTGQVKH